VNIPKEVAIKLNWKGNSASRTPFEAFTSEALYQTELDRLFYAQHWCYIGLEAEIPHPGDFQRSEIGERSVIMARTQDGEVSVVENACAHRGMALCRERSGHAQSFRCPYHQWNYDLQGHLIGVPFRRVVNLDGRVNGGMPADFDLEAHGLRRLRVSTRGGAVFASFDQNVESFEDFLGPEILRYYDRVFHGPKLTVLGYTRQRIPSNWKLMLENIKDPYHAGLLHTWLVNFGLFRVDNRGQIVTDAHRRHGALISIRGAGGSGQATQNAANFKAAMQLNDGRFLDVVRESWWGEPTVVIMSLMPSVVIQQQVNSMATRRIRPIGLGAFDFVWTHFGFETDDVEMTRRRLRQANLFGPAGFVSADDGEVLECMQRNFQQIKHGNVFNQLGGAQVDAHTDHIVSETLVRGMYHYWRQVMEA